MKKCIRTAALALLFAAVCSCCAADGSAFSGINAFASDGFEPYCGISGCAKTAAGGAETVSIDTALKTGLCPGGMAFGVKFFTEGILVVGISDVETFGSVVCPAEEAGILKGDVLLSVNGTKTESAEKLREAIEETRGASAEIVLTRGGKQMSVVLYPALSAAENKYRAGLLVRDSTAGIGTVTYIDAESGKFAGLGHGICDSDTGGLMPLGRGVVVDVGINGVRKGRPGTPGELRGAFGDVQRGTIDSNTETGVYGRFDDVPSNIGRPLPVGLKDELKEGTAFIYTTLRGSSPEKFEIEIEKIYRNSGSTKNFLIKVTDVRLLRATGGIVQGMSGSPIVQDGKIVGAVTHVLINDPTQGYGIFIENMITAAEALSPAVFFCFPPEVDVCAP